MKEAQYVTERRRHRRIELEVEVTVRTEGALIPGRSQEISEYGMSAIVPVELREGESVELQIKLPRGNCDHARCCAASQRVSPWIRVRAAGADDPRERIGCRRSRQQHSRSDRREEESCSEPSSLSTEMFSSLQPQGDGSYFHCRGQRGDRTGKDSSMTKLANFRISAVDWRRVPRRPLCARIEGGPFVYRP